MTFFLLKIGNIDTSKFAAPKLALVPASRYYCDITGHTTMYVYAKVSLGLKEVQMETHDFE